MIEKHKKWTKDELEKAVKDSTSTRQVLKKIGLVEAGGNYDQVKKYIRLYGFDTSHFRGQAWNKGLTGLKVTPKYKTSEILIQNSSYQSYKLKKRLFNEGIKSKKCELCGWAKKSTDGRIPLELDHINGDRHDNRINNLRVLCPNCHSLQTTHRGKNMRKKPILR